MPDEDWIKLDLHIHTLDDPKDVIDYSAHQLLERAKELGFGVLAITLHDAVFDPAEVFADAAALGIPLIATSDAHQLHAFGRHYTSIPRPSGLTVENVFAALREGPLRLTSPSASIVDLASAIYWIFLAHPFKLRQTQRRGGTPETHSHTSSLESKSQT